MVTKSKAGSLHNPDERPIGTSQWAYPWRSILLAALVFWICIVVVSFVVQDRFTHKITIFEIKNVYDVLNHIIGMTIVVLLFLLFTFFSVCWRARRISVYSTCIDFSYVLHPNWNYSLKVSDVESYYKVRYEKDKEKKRGTLIRMDGGLWWYADDEVYKNYTELVNLLIDQFKLRHGKGKLNLTKAQIKKLRKGNVLPVNQIQGL